MKKFLSVILAVCMVMSMAAVAMADTVNASASLTTYKDHPGVSMNFGPFTWSGDSIYADLCTADGKVLITQTLNTWASYKVDDSYNGDYDIGQTTSCSITLAFAHGVHNTEDNEDYFWRNTEWYPCDNDVPAKFNLYIDGVKVAEVPVEIDAEEWAALEETLTAEEIAELNPAPTPAEDDNAPTPAEEERDEVVAAIEEAVEASVVGAVVDSTEKADNKKADEPKAGSEEAPIELDTKVLENVSRFILKAIAGNDVYLTFVVDGVTYVVNGKDIPAPPAWRIYYTFADFAKFAKVVAQ